MRGGFHPVLQYGRALACLLVALGTRVNRPSRDLNVRHQHSFIISPSRTLRHRKPPGKRRGAPSSTPLPCRARSPRRMTISKGTLFAGLPGPLAAALLAAGCSDSVGPQAPRFDMAPTVVRITGLGQIGTGSPSPGNNVQTFNFDVRSDLTESLTFSDYSIVRADGSVGTLTVDPTDAATAITAFRTSSSACSDPSNGAEFDGTGREDAGGGGGLLGFTVVACDNGPAGSALDFFSLAVPSDAYQKSGSLTSGDVAKSTISSSGGSLVVSTSTTGSSLPTSGYTVTVDPGTSRQTSQPIAPT